ncbi:hypothetical protein V1478_012854 [Vespula squamosa]|uniref:Uncharacterized protein n=1 Tax=Vespula squamosa TaxID=30214 RepID=A0ABD2A954_VESSQ
MAKYENPGRCPKRSNFQHQHRKIVVVVFQRQTKKKENRKKQVEERQGKKSGIVFAAAVGPGKGSRSRSEEVEVAAASSRETNKWGDARYTFGGSSIRRVVTTEIRPKYFARRARTCNGIKDCRGTIITSRTGSHDRSWRNFEGGGRVENSIGTVKLCWEEARKASTYNLSFTAVEHPSTFLMKQKKRKIDVKCSLKINKNMKQIEFKSGAFVIASITKYDI